MPVVQFVTRILLLVLIIAGCQVVAAQTETETDTDRLIKQTLAVSGENEVQLSSALDQIELEFKPGMEFLLAYLPDSDAKTLSADFLLEHVRGAYAAWHQSPWHEQVSESIFFNNILPYASVSERREQWRNKFRDRFLPLVASAQSPGVAAVILNQKIFDELGVKYSTKRKRADQGPYESIEGGTASCTGLSILLIDACRSVGVPARLVGTPCWSDGSGNHSWVEVWDGDWKFTGAAEPTEDKLNQAWFVERAVQAQADEPKYSIYAVSYMKTDTEFPLVWKKDFDPVWSINVTERYTALDDRMPKIKDDQILVRIRVVDTETSERVATSLTIKDEQDNIIFEGKSKDESCDANDHLNVPLAKNSTFVIEHQQGDNQTVQNVIVTLDDLPNAPVTISIDPRPDSKAGADHELAKDEVQNAANKIWKQHQTQLLSTRAEEMKNKRIKLDEFSELEMKYEYKTFGEKPAAGHALFISMHGGGGAPAKVNEKQWKNQIGLYEPAEGIYLAPRAPTDNWNLWHESHIDSFFDRVIENFVAAGDVDPNRVYIMGYSAGGDGVFQLAPRMADRFAGAAMMAGHPNETKPLGLRNLPFAIYMGGKDAAYNRNEQAENWKVKLAALQKADPTGYPHLVTIYPEKGHWMDREDASALPWLAQHTRIVWPKKIVWHQDDVTHNRFYWLSVPDGKATAGSTITAAAEGQKISIESEDITAVRIWLSDELLDLDREIEILVNGESQTHRVERTIGSLKSSFESRADKSMMAPAFLDLKID